VGEPSVFVGALCSADIKGTNVTVDEGETALLSVKVSGADVNTTLSLSLVDGTAISSDYGPTLYYSFVNANTDMNTITWTEYTGNISVPENASRLIVKTNTILDSQVESDEIYKLVATLSTGESGTGTVTIVDNIAPVSTNDEITTIEDKSIVLSLSDFGTYSDGNGDSLSSIKITALPTNGTFTFDGVAMALAIGSVISASDINAGKLVFTPTLNTDLDSSFKFQVSDGKQWSSDYTTIVNVTAVADAPSASIVVGNPTTIHGVIVKEIIDSSNVNNTNGGFSITATDARGNISTVASVITGTNHDGFGVSGVASGADTEIGFLSSSHVSEKLLVDLGTEVYSIDVSFAWKHQVGIGETAVIKFYKNGVLVGETTDYGGSDTVDAAKTFAPINGAIFDSVEFSALTDGSDYLVHSISYDKVVSVDSIVYPVDITAALADTDGSEVLSVIITNVPTGATLSSYNPNYTLVENSSDHTWSVKIPSGETAISDTITMSVPSSNTQNINLGITAKATETNDNIDGSNYETNNVNTLNYDGDDIDLTSIIASNSKIDVISLSNSTNDKITVELKDLIADDDHQLMIKGDAGDIVQLDTPSDWSNAGKEQVDGISYNVFTGTGTNSTIKLLIDDDIDVTPDI
jgi:hypothetical protein